jgi:uncharacterized membrane protein YkvA (DUF1232 family)
MSVAWIAVLGGLVLVCGALGVAALLAWRRDDPEERNLVRRILRLPVRRKLHLAVALVRDSRIPLVVRAIPPTLVLYLATPIDLIPDFIPVLGHLDDAVVLILGVGLLLRFTSGNILEEHVSRLEVREASA